MNKNQDKILHNLYEIVSLSDNTGEALNYLASGILSIIACATENSDKRKAMAMTVATQIAMEMCKVEDKRIEAAVTRESTQSND